MTTHGAPQRLKTRKAVVNGPQPVRSALLAPPTRLARARHVLDDDRVTLSPAAYTLPRWQLDANSLWRSSGERQRLPWEQDGYSYAAHVAYLEDLDQKIQLGRAHGRPVPTDNPWVWWDISRIKVLNGRVAKEAEDEKHIRPLQLDLIERCITRWSNAGDVVLDYFAGIGSVPYVALQLGRRGVGVELKRSYFEVARRFLDDLELQQAQPTSSI